jgi:hypothetical protein
VGALSVSAVETGAETYGVSGYSNSDYHIETAYSPDLDFGTSDFYISVFAKYSAGGVVVERAYYSGGYSGSAFRLDQSANTCRFRITDDGFSTFDDAASSAILKADEWTHILAFRRGSNIYLRLDGIQQATAAVSAAAASLNNANAVLSIGRRVYAAAPLTGGSISMVRIGAGSPTDAQAVKMAILEKELFKQGAKFKLGNASVLKTTYDWKYNIAIAATSAGAYWYKDLTHVDSNVASGWQSLAALDALGGYEIGGK